MLVVGPAVKKRILTRGDAKNFPKPLDDVEIRLKARIYHEGKLIHREKSTRLKFLAGLSGKSIHVQILGARNLIAADLGGTSDPFIVGVFNGRKIGSTRVRQRTLHPKWMNETIIVPLEDHTGPSSHHEHSSPQNNIFRLEVYVKIYIQHS